ncbi:SDR family NAD(P)-dependent oxidoreductase [Arthrobacter mobilis]|uniref:SDR family oxidoreductase n=1 Tax=Arthrobacter mobilis TaxID=2724944 RepID=A0A7X6HDY4_9MICC|nr:SDR family NAD(P)-dependent oxidoreductase [Arthrobacter mobilis]NKX54216.1 SDR family oxidoreductase [Arthrobacter mobilis]
MPHRDGLFQDRTVLVTGAGSGIGRAAAVAFGAEGARVVASDVDPQAAAGTAELIDAAGGTADSFAADVSAESDVEALIGFAVARFGGLDAALNNAGVPGAVGPLDELDSVGWERVQNTNLRGVWLCLKYEVGHMKNHGGGAIVNVSSVAGIVGNPGSAAYTAAKHGVVGLTRAAAGEYGAAGIRINAVSPGLTRTPLIEGLKRDNPALAASLGRNIPLGRAAEPSEIAEAALWLASAKASFVHGHTLVVDGGFSVL